MTNTNNKITKTLTQIKMTFFFFIKTIIVSLIKKNNKKNTIELFQQSRNYKNKIK